MTKLNEVQLKKSLELLLKIRTSIVEADLMAQNAISQFHKDTEKRYKAEGEELQEIYPRLIRLINSVADDIAQIKTIGFGEEDY